MKVIGFCGPSGVGKTTLIEQLIPLLKAQGLRVSVIKHAHKNFDIDQPGKDSFRHRQAGAFEVLIASGQRLAKLRDFELMGQPTIHQLLGELLDCDWVLAEGFKHADIGKIELLRAALPGQALYPDDPYVVALYTDALDSLPRATQHPVFASTEVQDLADFLLASGPRFEYPLSEHHV